MTADEVTDFDAYQRDALRTVEQAPGDPEGLSLAAMGLAGEGAELLELFLKSHDKLMLAVRASVAAGNTTDFLKKVLHHGHQLDRDRVKNELGDLFWYATVLGAMCDLKLSEVIQNNVRKRLERYPTGWDPKRSQMRKDA